jgi:hypothetical protein
VTTGRCLISTASRIGEREVKKKISETQLEVTKADYTPGGNLAILFLNKLPQK